MGPIFFLIYINDLPYLAPIDTKILLYADDTSIIVTSPNLENFETKIEKLFGDINKWFQANQLTLNYNKTNHLGLIIDDCLSWKAHIDQTASKLNTACFAIRTIQATMSSETLKMVYFAYVHSIMSYGITFWGNQPYSDKIFKIKKGQLESSQTQD